MLTQSDRDLVAAFMGSLQHAGMSPGSRSVYKSSVVQWLRAGGRPGHVDRELMLRYIGHRRAKLSASTVNGDLKALRRWYSFLAACGHCATACIAAVPKGRPAPRRLPRTLSLDQVAHVLTQPDPTTWIGYRDTVLIRLLADTGLRTTQVSRLCLGSVLDDGTLYIQRYRQRPDLYIPLSAELQAMLSTYIISRGQVRPQKRAALFLSCYGRPLAAASIGKIVSAHIRAAVGRSIGCCMRAVTGRPWQGQYPHLLRATLAQNYLDRGLPATTVAQLLGLADVGSLAKYAGIDLKPMRIAIAKHPRNSPPAKP